MGNAVPGPVLQYLMLINVEKSGTGEWGIKAFGGYGGTPPKELHRGRSFGVIQAAIQLRAASFTKPSRSFLPSQVELCMHFLLLQ